MIVSIKGKPLLWSRLRDYRTKREREKAQDALNLLAIAAILSNDESTTNNGSRLDLNFETNKHTYTTAHCSGFYELDGSSEAFFHLVNHEYLHDTIMKNVKISKPLE